MSDDLYPETPWDNNHGATLPAGTSATHNAGLSPLFINRNGRNNGNTTEGYAITWRGNSGYAWTVNTERNMNTYHVYFSATIFSPSGIYTRFQTFPLRCLVSTNNT